MNERALQQYPEPGHQLTIRDVVQVGFRHQYALVACFVGVILVAVIYNQWSPPKYESETKLILKRDRVDPILSSEQQSPTLLRDSITEEEINSEVEILLSYDVLRQVVIECGLYEQQPSFWYVWFGRHQQEEGEKRIASAAASLKRLLVVDPVKKANIIQLTYRAHDPELPPRVLSALNNAYLKKHLAVHRPAGQFTFFEQKTTDYANNMKLIEGQLQEFSRTPGSVRPELVRDITLQKLADVTGNLSNARVAIAETESRIRLLEQEGNNMPLRMTTVVRQLDNPELLKELKSTLLNLELRHSELLNKFQPDYRPVKLVEDEIQKTKSAIAAANGEMLRDETTDVDTTRRWIDEELAKERADLNGLLAREAATVKAIAQYQATVFDLQDKGIAEQDLVRELKATEDNYLLYRHKREEARITDALDEHHILNVAVVEEPTVPYEPVHPVWLFPLFGIFVAGIVSAAMVFALDFLDSSFRTPAEVQAVLNIPVLATVPLFFESRQIEPNGSGRNDGSDIHGTEAAVRTDSTILG